jgi:hypothetical protein
VCVMFSTPPCGGRKEQTVTVFADDMHVKTDLTCTHEWGKRFLCPRRLVCYRKRAEAHRNEMQDLNTKLRSQLMTMLQSMLSATIPKVNASANSHSNESEPTKSESCSSDTQITQTTNHKHNTRSRKDNECKKVTFENTTVMFPKVNVPVNSHSNESTSINSASHSPHAQVTPTTYHEHNIGSRKANECKNTTFENTTPNFELLTPPTGNLATQSDSFQGWRIAGLSGGTQHLSK